MTDKSVLPDFELPATGNQRFQLSAFKGHPFVLYFYPRDDTPGCTDEGKQFRDLHAKFVNARVPVFGVSRDSPWTHIAWAQTLDLSFPLLSDWNAEAVQGFGVSRDFRGFRDIARRAAFLVDGEGTVRATWSYEDSEVPDFDELVRAAQAL